jgi:hypothetical protein
MDKKTERQKKIERQREVFQKIRVQMGGGGRGGITEFHYEEGPGFLRF